MHSFFANNRKYALHGIADHFNVPTVPFTRLKQGRYIASLLACEVLERHYMLLAVFLAYIYADPAASPMEKSWLHLFLSADFRALIHIGSLASLLFRYLMNQVVKLTKLSQLRHFLSATLTFACHWLPDPSQVFNLSAAQMEHSLRGTDPKYKL